MSQLDHLAIIMDGNGRWAKQRGHNRVWGHLRGARVAKNTIKFCVQNNIKTLSLFAFSTENWQRPKMETQFLMNLLSRNLKRELKLLQENNIQFSCIGNTSQLPAETRNVIKEIEEKTSSNNGMKLVFAVSYSGRQDITNCVKAIVDKSLTGQIKPEDISEETIQNHLSTFDLKDPDLIIRTSGELRISNFYLWQAAYCELYFINKFWPDISDKDLSEAVQYFHRRDRRFGRVDPNNEFQPNNITH